MPRRLRVATVKTAAVEAPAIEAPPLPAAAPALEGGSSHELFNWFKCWYPVATLDSLYTDRPNAVELLGMKLVAWRPRGSASWSVLEDTCPHRLAPLSEGRIHEDGSLQCSYHGWCFDGAGGCKSIPQIGDPKAHATACSSGRSAVAVFPCQELFGLLWVWAEPGPIAAVEAAAAPPAAAPPELLSGDWTLKQDWFQRDAPVPYDALVENIVDPSHVQFSHHGVIGNRYAVAHGGGEVLRPISVNGGFSFQFEGAAGTGSFPVDFTPPCLSQWRFHPQIGMLLYAVPTRKGWTRVWQVMAGPKDSTMTRPPSAGIPPLAGFFIDLIGRIPWMLHAVQHNHILDGDDLFVAQAAKRLYKTGALSSWRRRYFMPSSVDAGVTAWRTWLDRHGRACPALPAHEGDTLDLPKSVVFDRLNQHTRHCSHCRAALANMTAAMWALAAVAAAAAGALVAGVAAAGVPLASKFAAAAAGVALVAGFAAAGLARFRQLFIYYEYVHADH